MSDPSRSPKPLVFQLMRRQTPRPRRPARYDASRDELLVSGPGGWVPALDAEGGDPRTKKADVEKGEDVKGGW